MSAGDPPTCSYPSYYYGPPHYTGTAPCPMPTWSGVTTFAPTTDRSIEILALLQKLSQEVEDVKRELARIPRPSATVEK